MQLYKTLSIILLSLLLFSCGGELGKDSNTSGADTSMPVELTLRLLDCPSGWNQNIALCSDTTQISASKSAIVAVSLKKSGVALSSEIVTANVSKGALQPDSVLTNSQGIAFFTLSAESDEGAGRITVNTDAAEQDTTKTLNFAIGISNVDIEISNNTAGTALAQNSTALITVKLSTDQGPYTSPVIVSFSSACAAAGTAKLDSTVTAVNGIAQATYQPTGCVGEDIITANAAINNLSANTSVTVASSPAKSLSFLGASPKWIALEGTGGLDRQETSIVTFKLVDINGLPSTLQDVAFTLNNAPSGTLISPTVGKTNSDGEVSTVVSAGKIPGVVRVSAHVVASTPLLATVSDELTISTGLPDQDSFSLSLADHAPESLNTDGVSVAATVQLADRFNNAVPDGTAVYFRAEGGAIRDAATGTLGSCVTAGSQCQMQWISQNPRPAGNRLTVEGLAHGCAAFAFDPSGQGVGPCINGGGMGQPYGGRITITAFAVGEENFVDNDADGWFSDGDAFIVSQDDLSELFFDDNEDGYYKEESNAINMGDEREEYHDLPPFNGVFDQGDQKYNGLLCSDESLAAGACSRDLINVRAHQYLIMASSDQFIRVQNGGVDNNAADLTVTGKETLNVYFADIYNNHPPTGTKISVATENGLLSGKTEWVVEDNTAYGPFAIEIHLINETEPNKKTVGKLVIELNTPKGGTLSFSMNVTDAG